MIRILKEVDVSNENLTDNQIQNLYDTQKNRIIDKTQVVIDMIVEKLSKYKESIVNEVMTEYISSIYFDNNHELIIVSDDDDIEDRIEEIKDINKLSNISDESVENEINDIIKKILFND